MANETKKFAVVVSGRPIATGLSRAEAEVVAATAADYVGERAVRVVAEASR